MYACAGVRLCARVGVCARMGGCASVCALAPAPVCARARRVWASVGAWARAGVYPSDGEGVIGGGAFFLLLYILKRKGGRGVYGGVQGDFGGFFVRGRRLVLQELMKIVFFSSSHLIRYA